MHKVTAKKAKYLFNRLYSSFEQKKYFDSRLLKYFNYIEEEIEEALLIRTRLLNLLISPD